MAALSDHSLGLAIESTFGTPIAPDHFFEWLASSKMDHDPNVIYPKGLRVGSRFARASRRTGLVAKPDGKLDFELASRGFGVALQAAFGTAASNAITGGYQQLFQATTTGSTLPSFAAQEGLVRADGTVVAHTWRGCTAKSAEFSQGLDGFLMLSLAVDAKVMHITRSVTDGVTTSGSPTFTSATAAFAASDVGAPISATGIPAATTISAVNSATSVTLSANATATGSTLATTIGQPYATPSYPTGATLYSAAANPQLANVVLGGTLTVPTTTALGSISGGTTVAACKSWKVALDNQVAPREAIGQRNQPTTGGRVGTVEMDIEYDATTGLLLERAQVDKTTFPLVLSSQTAEVITGSGYATFQLVFPSVGVDAGAIPQPTDGGVASTSIKLGVLDDEVAASSVYGVLRTVDTSL
jgi:hypothetical protein